MLNFKTDEVKSTLLEELLKVFDDMRRHFAHQKSENNRLDQQILQLKNERIVLKNQINMVDRRIKDLEMQVGHEDIKYG
jgi:septal ring factor EnvC (AmiA/AmiB activator)